MMVAGALHCGLRDDEERKGFGMFGPCLLKVQTLESSKRGATGPPTLLCVMTAVLFWKRSTWPSSVLVTPSACHGRHSNHLPGMLRTCACVRAATRVRDPAAAAGGRERKR